ncbi:two-partner secretion domain-containing protein, partial [Cetobacterium sp.]
MKEVKINEKLLKRNLKNKRKITLSLVITFLISGMFEFEEVEARDLRSRKKESNNIIPDYGGPNLNTSANKTDVVNIVDPNSSGISHNKFVDLSVGSGNGLIFNNSMEHGTSQIGGYVTKNTNLTKNAKVILNEVRGNNVSNINGDIEVFGVRADFILANENGITLNGATFINTSGVTLSTGKVSNTGSNINFDVQKGNIELNGVGTSGDYFNILAKTVQIFKEVSPLKGEQSPDISIIAGENKLSTEVGKLKDINIVSSKKTTSDKYGIYASEFGSMYGKNIRLISTDEGLGVKHQGLIVSEKDIAIDSNGDIVLTSVNSKGRLDIKGKNLTTKKGVSNDKENSFINSISAKDNIDLNISGNINLESALQSTDGSIKIVAKNLTLADKTSARIVSKKNIVVNLSEKLDVQGVMIPTISGKPNLELIILVGDKGELQAKDIKSGKVYSSNEIAWVSTGIIGTQVDIFTKEIENKGLISADRNLKIDAKKIINHESSVIKGANIDIKAENSFINRGEIRENQKELNEFVDPLGKLKIEVSLGGFENYGNISAQKISILTQKLINSFAGKVIATNGDIVLTTSVGELINNGEILTDKNVKLISELAITNTGKIGADNILVQALKGQFLNAGQITAVKELEIIVNLLVNAGSSEEIEKYLNMFQEYSVEHLTKVLGRIKNLEEKIKLETDLEKIKALNETLEHFNTLRDRLVNLKKELSKTGSIGVLSSDKLNLKATEDVTNDGVITANKKLNLQGNNITNTGIIQGEDIFIKAIGDILNSRRITATNNILITGKSVVSMGSQANIKEYLKLVSSFDEKRLVEIDQTIKKLESQLENERNPKIISDLKSQINTLSKERTKLQRIKAKISSYGSLGVLEGNNIAVTTVNTLANNGILLSKGDVNLKSQGEVSNSGVATVEKDLKIDGNSFSNNNLTVGGKLVAKLEGMFESKNLAVGSDIDVKTSKLVSSDTLAGNGDLKLTGDFESTKGSKVQIKKDVSIRGEVKNSGNLTIGGNATVDTGSKDFISNGDLSIKGKANVSTNHFQTTGDSIIEGSLDLKAKDSFKNTGKFQVKEDASIKSKGFENKNLIVTGKNLIIDSKDGGIYSKDLSVGSNLRIDSKEIEINGDTTVGGEALINNTGDIENEGNLHVHKKLTINTKSLKSKGNISSSGLDLKLDGDFRSEGDIQSKGDVQIVNSKNGGDIRFDNGDVSIVGNLKVDSKESNLAHNKKILASGKIDLDVKSIDAVDGSQVGAGETLNITTEHIKNGSKSKLTGTEINLVLKGMETSKLGEVIGSKNISINSNSDISVNRIVTPEYLKIKLLGTLLNDGSIIGNKDIDIESTKLINNGLVWSGKDLNLNIFKMLLNNQGAKIEAKDNMSIVTETLLNKGGGIKAGKSLTIKTDVLENSSVITGELLNGKTETFEKDYTWNSSSFYYQLDYTKVTMPKIGSDFFAQNKGEILAGGDFTITGKTKEKSKVTNENGIIASSKNLNIKGDLINRSTYKELTTEWLLKNINVELHWETRLYGTGAYGNSGSVFKGSLWDALFGKNFDDTYNYRFYKSLAAHDNPVLNQLLSSVLGANWKDLDIPPKEEKWNLKDSFKFYPINGNAQILAGKDLNYSGTLSNDGGEAKGNKTVEVKIGNNVIDSTQSNIQVQIKDFNSVKEVEGIKQIHDVEILTGSVTIDGVTIKAETGNTAGAVAVAGTINPITFIDIPVGENGIFKPATPKPGQIQPLFETNVEFIDPNKFYGSNYFFEQIGYNKDKPSTVIGDAYYEYLLLSKILREAAGYASELSTKTVKQLLDNAVTLEKELGLKVGKPLTPQQINSLKKDIIWYVEIEVNGVKVLTPQIYLSKESRIKLANSQGSGGLSTIRTGGDIVADVNSFNNSNGNIVANGNVIVKSKGEITNNSSGGINGGITSTKGNVALDASGDINMIGGSVKADNVILSGNKVDIESTLGLDRNGNQVVSDKASIDGHNGVQIDSKNDINIKGGSLTASGLEALPKKEEKKDEGSEVSQKEKKDVTKVKDINYYKELFKKDSADIIEGDAGSINLNAGGSVNVNDIYTVSSTSKNEYTNLLNYSRESSSKATSNESKIIGSNVNINAEKNINIKGSSVGTNEGLISKDDKNEYVQGDINLNAKNDVVIKDSQQVSSEKKSSAKTSIESGLLSARWSKSERETSISKGSSLSTGGNLNISSGNNVLLKGSNIGTGNDTSINAKNNIDILDGKNVIDEYKSDIRFQVIGAGNTTSEKKSSTSKGSSILTGGKIGLNSGNNVEIVNGRLNSSKDTEIVAKNDVSVKAGKNEYSEKTTTTNIGVYVEGSAGIGGVGVSGSANTLDMSASGEVSREWGASGTVSEKLDSSNEKTPTISGKPHMDQLVSSEIGVKLEHSTKELDETTWSESQLKGDNITIKAGNTADIGGGDYKAKNSVTIKGKKVDTSKYEDVRNEKKDGFTLTLKQSQGVSSSVVDTINTGVKMDAAIKSGQANEGVLAAQGIGAATNLLFNDLVGVYSKQSVNLSVEKSTKNETSENITSIKGKNVSIVATEGDINLKGVDIKSEENTTLDAKNDINVSSSRKTSSESGTKVDLEAQLEQSAGYSALWGGNTDIGVGGSSNVDITSSTSKEMINSTIKSDGKLTIKSGADTNIKGAEIEAKKDANIKVGENLNIESQKSLYKEDSINANAGGNVSLGVASNTVGKAELGFSAGGGNIWKNGETVKQSGIKSGGNLVVDVGKDLNMTGGVLGSETG